MIVGGAGNSGGGGALPLGWAEGAGAGSLGKVKRGVCGDAAHVATQWPCALATGVTHAKSAPNAIVRMSSLRLT